MRNGLTLQQALFKLAVRKDKYLINLNSQTLL